MGPEEIYTLTSFFIVCPVKGCGKVYQDLGGIMKREEVERSLKAHLTGKHCLKGEAFQRAYRLARRCSRPTARGSQEAHP